MGDFYMNSDEEFLTISIGLTEEDYERRHKENSWYSVRFIYLLTKWRYTTWRSIRKSPKCYITFQVLLLLLLNNFYKVGALNAMDQLRSNPKEVKSIYFLTNCHATPFYSHIHR